MTDFNHQTAIALGGSDDRYARVIAVQMDGNAAAALVDANGDGADVNIDLYVRGSDGNRSNIASGNGDAIGSGKVVATRTSDNALVITRVQDDSD